MRLNYMRTTTSKQQLVGVACRKRCCRIVSDINQQQRLEENCESKDSHTWSYRYYREDSGATPQVKLPEREQARSARTTHTSRSVGREIELPTGYMPGSSAVVGG